MRIVFIKQDAVDQEQLNKWSNQFYINDLSKDIDKQLELLTEISSVLPSNPEVLFHLAQYQMKADHCLEAIQSFKKYLLHDEHTEEQVLQIAQLLESKSYFKESEQIIIQRLEKYEDNNQELYFELAKVQKNQGKFKTALEFFKESIRLSPYNQKYIEEFNLTLKEKAESEKTVSQKTLKTDPNSYSANFQYATALKQLNDLTLATNYYEKCINVQKENPSAYRGLIECQTNLKKFKEAQQQLLILQNLKENCPQTLFQQGYLHLLNKETSQSFQQFFKSVYWFYYQDSAESSLTKFVKHLQSIDCFQIEDIQVGERGSNNQKYFIKQQNKKIYKITINAYKIKLLFLSTFTDLLSQQSEFYSFFFHCGLSIIINKLIDQIIEKLYSSKQTQLITLYKSQYGKEKQTHYKNNKQTQKGDDLPIQHKLIITFKDNLKCFGKEKGLFEQILSWSFYLKNEYEHFSLKNLKQKYTNIEMNKMHLSYRILQSTNNNNVTQSIKQFKPEYTQIFNKCFYYFSNNNLEKAADFLLSFSEIKSLYFIFASELISHKNFYSEKLSFLKENLIEDPINQSTIQAFIRLIKYYQKAKDDKAIYQTILTLIECVHDGFIKQSDHDYKETYSFEIQKLMESRGSSKISSSSTLSWNSLINGELNNSQRKEAIQILRQHNKKFKKDFLSHYILGNIYFRNQEYERAKYYYYLSLMIEPLNERVMFKYAVILNVQRDIETSIQYLSEVYTCLGLGNSTILHLKEYFLKIDGWYIFNYYYKNNYSFYPLDILILNLDNKTVRTFPKLFKDRMKTILESKPQAIPDDLQVYSDCVMRKQKHSPCLGFCYFQQFLYYEQFDTPQKLCPKLLKFIRKCYEINPTLFGFTYTEALINTNNTSLAKASIKKDFNSQNLQNLDAHLLQAKYLFQLKKYDQCVKHIQSFNHDSKSISDYPQFSECLIKSYEQLNKLDKAIGVYEDIKEKKEHLLLIKIKKELRRFCSCEQYQNCKNNYYIKVSNAFFRIRQPLLAIKALKKFSANHSWFIEYCPSVEIIDILETNSQADSLNNILSFTSENIQENYQINQKSFQEKYLKSTIRNLNLFINKNINDQKPYLLLAFLHEQKSESNQMINILSKYLKQFPDDYAILQRLKEIHYIQGNKYYEEKSFYKSLNQFASYLELESKHTNQASTEKLYVNLKDFEDKQEVYNKLVNCSLKENLHTTAMKYLNMAISEFPQYTKMYIYLSHIYYSQNLFKSSEETANKLLEFEAENSDAHFQLAKIYYQQKEYLNSLESLKKCQNNPIYFDKKEISLQSCLVYIKLKKIKEFYELFEPLNSDLEFQEKNRYHFGYIFYKIKQYNYAVLNLKFYKENNEENSDKINKMLGECYYHLSGFKESLYFFNRITFGSWKKYRPYQIAVRQHSKKSLKSTTEEPQNKKDIIIENIQKKLNENTLFQNKLSRRIYSDKEYYLKNIVEIHYNISLQIFNERRNYTQVQSHLNICLEIEPKNVSCLILRAWLSYKLTRNINQTQKQISEIEEEKLANNLMGVLLLAKIYYRKEEYDLCQLYLDKVQQIDFANEYAGYLQVSLNIKQGKSDGNVELLRRCPLHYQSVRKIAKIKKNWKQYDVTNQYYLTAYSIKPWKCQNLLSIAQVNFNIKRYFSSIEYYESYLKQKNEKDFLTLAQIGRAYFELKKYREAVDNLEQSILLNPDQSYLWFLIGMSYYHLSQMDKSEKALLQSYNMNRHLPELVYQLGIFYNEKQDFKNAKIFFELCIEQKTNKVECLHFLGEIYYIEKQYDEALKYFSQCSALDRSHFSSLLYQSKILFKIQKNYEASTDILVKINLLDPKNICCVERLMKVYINTKNKTQSKELFQKYYNELSQSNKIQMKLAEYFFEEKEYDEILKIFEGKKGGTFNPTGEYIIALCYYIRKEYTKCNDALEKYKKENQIENYYFHYLSSVTLFRSNTKKKLIYHLRRCIEIDSTQIMPYFLQSLSYVEKNPQKAKELLEEAKAINSKFDFSDIQSIIEAKLQISEGKIEEGKEILMNTIKKFPSSELSYSTLGILLQQTNQSEQALKFLQKVLLFEKKPLLNIYFVPVSVQESINCKISLATIFESQKLYQKSLEMLELCLSADPKNSITLLKKAEILQKIGQISESVLCIQQYIELNPKSDLAYFFLGSLHMEQNKFYQAIYFFKKCKSINPNFKGLHLQMANAYEKDQQFDSALMEYNLQLNIDKTSTILKNIALIHIRNQNFEEAEKFIDDLIESDPQDSYSYYLKALNEMKQNKIDEEIKYLQKCCELDPKNINALSFLALAYSNKNQPIKEKSTYEYMLSFDPNNEFALNNLATIHQNNGDIGDAIELYQKCISIDKFSSEYLSNLGLCLLSQKQYSTALQILEQGVFIDYANTECIFNLALTNQALGNTEDAIKEYMNAIKVNPNFVHAYYNLGRLLQKQGKLQDAIKFYKLCLDKEKNYPKGVVNLANCYRKSKEYEQAKRCIKEFTGKYQQTEKMKYTLALTYGELKKYQKERNILQELHESKPACFDYVFHLGVSQKNLEQYIDAIDSFSICLKLFKEQEDDQNGEILSKENKCSEDCIILNLGECYNKAHMVVKEIEIYQYSIKKYPKKTVCYNNLGLAYEYFNNLEKAKQSYFSHTNLFPDDANCFFNLGNLYSKLSNHKNAVKNYELCLEKNPLHFECLHNLACLKIKQKQYQRAIYLFEKCLNIKPTDHFYIRSIKLLQRNS